MMNNNLKKIIEAIGSFTSTPPEVVCIACQERLTQNIHQFSFTFERKKYEDIDEAWQLLHFTLLDLLANSNIHIIGIKKVRQIISSSKLRQEKLLEKLKQDLRQQWVK